MTHILNILICLTIFATIHVATNDTSINRLIQGSSDSNHDDKISDLEKIVLDLASRLQVVESKNQVLDNRNKELTQKLAHHDKLLKDVTSRGHEFNCQDCICKENYELRSKIEDINDEFQKHLTSSTIRFSVLEQLLEDYNTTSDTRYAEVEEHFRRVDNTSDARYAEVEEHFRLVDNRHSNHVMISDIHFSQVDETLTEIATTLQVILRIKNFPIVKLQQQRLNHVFIGYK